jgi:hypothetical protein
MRKSSAILLITALLWLPAALNGQLGGDNTYEFLNLPWSARGSVLGGTIISLADDDPSLLVCNPALAGSTMSGMLTLGFASYLAGISFGSVHYVHQHSGNTTLAAGLNWLSYGSFIEANEAGAITGSFRAAEYAINIAGSRKIDTIFAVGVNLKPILSQLESYTSVGFAVDIGGFVTSRDSTLTAGIVLRNIGMQLTTYAGETREKIPFEIQAGISKKLPHAPLRFSLTMRNLQKFNLTHDYDTIDFGGITGSTDADAGFTEKLLRHALFGIECLPHRNFWVGAGYNYQRRSELRIENGGAAAGFSWGFGLNISGFRLAFSRATYHMAGGTTQFSLSLNPGSIYRKITN